jgi:soluble lytic murein transglycosylase-like protein
MKERNKTSAFIVAILLPGLAFAATSKPRHDLKSKAWTSEYDHHFRKYTKRYFGPNFDWHWFKSQGIAESGLRNEARSGVGAVGVMQILPTTYADIHKKSPYLSSGTLSDPRWNIAAGIFYDRILYKRWSKSLKFSTKENDLYMTFASYNAGHGRISRVLKKVKNKPGGYDNYDSWGTIKTHVPSQTRHYVKRIKFLMGK